MPLQIEIANRQKSLPLKPSRLKTIATAILSAEGVQRATLSLVFVTDREIIRLNKEFLGRNHATDVLAFSLGEDAAEGTLEGEIIISTVTARRQAKVFGTRPDEELVLYVIHGILHLLGYDDHRPADIKRMRAREAELMEHIRSEGLRV